MRSFQAKTKRELSAGFAEMWQEDAFATGRAAGRSSKQQTTRKAGRPSGRPKTLRRRRHKSNPVLWYILFFLVLAGTVTTLSLTVLFPIEEITVTGCSQYPQQQLVETTGIQLGENLLRIPRAAIRERLLELPYVDEVAIRIDYPPTVYITITQATAVAALQQGTSYALLSAKGRLLATGLPEPPEELPLALGLQAEGLGAGEYLPPEQQEALQMLTALSQAAQANGFEGLRLIDLSDRLNLTAVYENRVILEFGSEGALEYKLRFAREIMESYLEPGFEGKLDLSVEKELRARPGDIHKQYPQLGQGIEHTLPEVELRPNDTEETPAEISATPNIPEPPDIPAPQ